MKSILEDFGLQERLVCDFKQGLLEMPAYESIDHRLFQTIYASEDYLKKALTV
jgi:hypothetical protein